MQGTNLLNLVNTIINTSGNWSFRIHCDINKLHPEKNTPPLNTITATAELEGYVLKPKPISLFLEKKIQPKIEVGTFLIQQRPGFHLQIWTNLSKHWTVEREITLMVSSKINMDPLHGQQPCLRLIVSRLESGWKLQAVKKTAIKPALCTVMDQEIEDKKSWNHIVIVADLLLSVVQLSRLDSNLSRCGQEGLHPHAAQFIRLFIWLQKSFLLYFSHSLHMINLVYKRWRVREKSCSVHNATCLKRETGNSIIFVYESMDQLIKYHWKSPI